MDIAATIINYLDRVSEVGWYHNSPKSAPTEYGTLTRDGGAYDSYVRDMPTITLIVYAATRGRCAELAGNTKQQLIRACWEVDNIFQVEIFGDYYDPVDGKHRHRITAQVTVND